MSGYFRHAYLKGKWEREVVVNLSRRHKHRRALARVTIELWFDPRK